MDGSNLELKGFKQDVKTDFFPALSLMLAIYSSSLPTEFRVKALNVRFRVSGFGFIVNGQWLRGKGFVFRV
jgi:hypothetical protein